MIDSPVDLDLPARPSQCPLAADSPTGAPAFFLVMEEIDEKYLNILGVLKKKQN